MIISIVGANKKYNFWVVKMVCLNICIERDIWNDSLNGEIIQKV